MKSNIGGSSSNNNNNNNCYKSIASRIALDVSKRIWVVQGRKGEASVSNRISLCLRDRYFWRKDNNNNYNYNNYNTNNDLTKKTLCTKVSSHFSYSAL